VRGEWRLTRRPGSDDRDSVLCEVECVTVSKRITYSVRPRKHGAHSAHDDSAHRLWRTVDFIIPHDQGNGVRFAFSEYENQRAFIENWE
jgi:hypothetical protein